MSLKTKQGDRGFPGSGGNRETSASHPAGRVVSSESVRERIRSDSDKSIGVDCKYAILEVNGRNRRGGSTSRGGLWNAETERSRRREGGEAGGENRGKGKEERRGEVCETREGKRGV